ncbi:MAG: HD domain-containing protein [Deltaproteobacteria bacterium]|nr:HD domain-containing protein [Deltaproteobacteria bacterium]
MSIRDDSYGSRPVGPDDVLAVPACPRSDAGDTASPPACPPSREHPAPESFCLPYVLPPDRPRPLNVNALTDLFLELRPEGTGADWDVELIRTAYVQACYALRGTLSLPGEPYLAGPLAAAEILATSGLEADSVAAGLLKEPMERGLLDRRGLATDFLSEAARIAAEASDRAFHAPWPAPTWEGDAARAARFDRALRLAVRDPRTLAVRLASLLYYMRLAPLLPKGPRAAFAQESLDFSAPLAGVLGLPGLKCELEDLSLLALRPRDFSDIAGRLTAQGPHDRPRHVNETARLIGARLAEFGIRCEVRGRLKHVYGVWRKMILQNLPFKEIYDLFSFRVTVDSVQDCYRALGVVHAVFVPLPGRFKDYISIPAPDGYRSLHTAVVGPGGLRAEIRIGDRGMRGRRGDDARHSADEARHRRAGARRNRDVAWRDGDDARQLKVTAGFGGDGPEPMQGTDRHALEASAAERLEDLAASFAAARDLDPSSRLALLRKALDPDGPVLAFTTMNTPVKLAQGATPIDFAYRIDPGLGDHLAAAYVDGLPVALGHRLGSLSTVRLVTDGTARPEDGWLKLAASPKTRAMIRHALSGRQHGRQPRGPAA